jgi:hypothetical protein
VNCITSAILSMFVAIAKIRVGEARCGGTEEVLSQCLHNPGHQQLEVLRGRSGLLEEAWLKITPDGMSWDGCGFRERMSRNLPKDQEANQGRPITEHHAVTDVRRDLQ